jgi:hypothetical protein
MIARWFHDDHVRNRTNDRKIGGKRRRKRKEPSTLKLDP